MGSGAVVLHTSATQLQNTASSLNILQSLTDYQFSQVVGTIVALMISNSVILDEARRRVTASLGWRTVPSREARHTRTDGAFFDNPTHPTRMDGTNKSNIFLAVDIIICYILWPNPIIGVVV